MVKKFLMICLFVLTQLTNVTDRQTHRHHMTSKAALDASIARQKPHSNGPLYSNALISAVAVDGWAVTFGTARRDLGGLRFAQTPPPRCTKCNSPPINGQCTNFVLLRVTL